MRPAGPPALPAWLSALLLAAGAISFALAWNIAINPLPQGLVQTDLNISLWLAAQRSPALTQWLLVITQVHALPAIALYSCALAAWLASRRQFDWLLALALVVPPGMLLNGLLKLAYGRARPQLDEPLLVLHTYSFPSGHTSGAVLLYGFIAAYLLPQLSRPGRVICLAATLLMMALVGLSRVYLGVHFASDVLAAAGSATVWLVAALLAAQALQLRLQLRRSA